MKKTHETNRENWKEPYRFAFGSRISLLIEDEEGVRLTTIDVNPVAGEQCVDGKVKGGNRGF